ncbi:MAG: hypothetical protein ACRD3E_16565, partial [Terriglobales bacterium]
MRTALIVLLLTCSALAQNAPLPECCPAPTDNKNAALWDKLKQAIDHEDRGLHGVLGVAILDLTDGHTLFVNPDEVFT